MTNYKYHCNACYGNKTKAEGCFINNLEDVGAKFIPSCIEIGVENGWDIKPNFKENEDA